MAFSAPPQVPPHISIQPGYNDFRGFQKFFNLILAKIEISLSLNQGTALAYS